MPNQGDLFREGYFAFVRMVSADTHKTTFLDPAIYMDEQGVEYVVKTATERHPFLICNEMVSAALAVALDIPVPSLHIRTVRGTQRVCSEYIRGTMFEMLSQDEVQAHPTVKQDICRMAALDQLVLNEDRHIRNMLFVSDGDTDNLRVYAIDHDRTLFSKCLDEQRLLAKHSVGGRWPPHQDFALLLRDLGVEVGEFSVGLAAVEQLADDTIMGIVDRLPDALLSPDYKTLLVRVLLERRTNIRQYFANCLQRPEYRAALNLN